MLQPALSLQRDILGASILLKVLWQAGSRAISIWWLCGGVWKVFGAARVQRHHGSTCLYGVSGSMKDTISVSNIPTILTHIRHVLDFVIPTKPSQKPSI